MLSAAQCVRKPQRSSVDLGIALAARHGALARATVRPAEKLDQEPAGEGVDFWGSEELLSANARSTSTRLRRA